MRAARCSNDNHGRVVVSVRFCPSCGTIVNGAIHPPQCLEASHAQMRRSQSNYCIDCGSQLVQRR